MTVGRRRSGDWRPLCIKRLPINMMYDAGPERSPFQPLATEIAT